MKKIFLVLLFAVVGLCVRAAENQTENISENTQTPAVMTQEERHKIFKERNKEIRKLVKKYRKASAEEKPKIKERLAKIVSQTTDESMAWSKARIAAGLGKLLRHISTTRRSGTGVSNGI